jgi:hypothetical protein
VIELSQGRVVRDQRGGSYRTDEGTAEYEAGLRHTADAHPTGI